MEVAVALPVPGTFHYAVPETLAAAVRVGTRVLVPFGGRGVTGVIVGQADTKPEGVSAIRQVREVLDETPALGEDLIDLCRWVAAYYEAPLGEVLRAALPAGTQVASRERLRLSERGRAALRGEANMALPDTVRRRLAALEAGRKLPPREAAALREAGFVEVEEERQEARVRTRRVATVTLLRSPDEDERARLGRARRRLELLELLESGETFDLPDLRRTIRGASAAVKALAEMGLVVVGTREVRADGWDPPAKREEAPTPTEEQARALEAIRAPIAARQFAPFLLHGVTGSGKTEVYLRAIAEVLARGRGAIVLVPEIALTPQLAARFRARFGDQVAVLHSGLTDRERFEEWRRLRAKEARIALGARSAVFAPVADLGIVVVDEEHDSSFKQEEGVRYHARDVALVRAQRAGAVCLLGSATPSLETFVHAEEGRYRRLELRARPSARPLPEVEVVDMKIYRPDAESFVTAPLAAALEATLAAGEQAILFLNRRGFATFVICTACAHSFRCPHCSVSLTYHRQGERLRCHYCGHAEHLPIECPRCHASGTILRRGLGTERIEAALRARYPNARVGRLDRDTAAGRGLRDVLERVAARQIDVLVGTQMVTKGHDFPGVTLVGVLCADTALSLPDFRAAERTFQLLTQVAGRAGRGERPGRVVIQTYDPTHPAVACARTHDYHAFAAAEKATRAELGYPPHGKLVAIRIDGPVERDVIQAAEELARRAHALAPMRDGIDILGPAEAPLKRLMGRTRWHLWAKGTDRARLRAFVRRLVADLDRFRPGVRITVDVDPVSAL